MALEAESKDSSVIRLPRHPLAQDPVMPIGEVTMEDTMEVTAEVTMEVAALLKVVHGEMSRQEIQVAMGLKHAEYFREAYVLPAINAGCLGMTLPQQPNSRLQRYRLTEKGKQWLRAQGVVQP